MALGSIVPGGLALVPVIGMSAWLAHRAADKKIAEIKPQIEKMRTATQDFQERASSKPSVIASMPSSRGQTDSRTRHRRQCRRSPAL
jgi:hypothetical protein